MKNQRRKGFRLALLTTGAFSSVAIATAYYVQKASETKVSNIKCSYLDPISIDILAFTAGIFLICDGLYELIGHEDLSKKEKILVSVRVAFGCAILTLHTMQFLHK